MNRREFVKLMQAGTGVALMPDFSTLIKKPLFFDISLAEWSLRQPIRNGDMSNLDFPQIAREKYGISAVEYVSGFFEGREEDQNYLKELNQRADDQGVKNVLIMVDLWDFKTASPDVQERQTAIDKHKPWIDAAQTLGCHAIRINANGYEGLEPEEAADTFADTLTKLSDYGKQADISIIVENHGGLSSNGKWLAGVMKQVNTDNVGTLPDFGNIKVSDDEQYDRYLLIEELMPYAKGVSAKTFAFDKKGRESSMDISKLMKTVKDAGFKGYVGIEFGGELEKISDKDGVASTKKLLEKVGSSLS
ncbi:sugar phosphate isomerase/epimerase [Catalinimonas alkaloidigena]|uniref:sugar phosphate isomerase/epimerase family protein n=1 Tax=Catalinimonas alkaloidigena TaxID=1075417 RepID=UPI0024073EF7|nr:sugar phosphate isomerase/epimerase family protein [Catalinimonas alkaloidigena]MDF9797558.1 sugar phosphate isomerase/epimerase [Catalinimonas alkaloidigena]